MSYQRISAKAQQYPTYPASKYATQAAPVQNTWYTIADFAFPIELLYMCGGVLTTAETMEFRITIDGVSHTKTGVVAVANSLYPILFMEDMNTGRYLFTGAAGNENQGQPSNQKLSIKCSAFKLEMRKTSAVGAGTLVGIVEYLVI